MGVQVRKLPFKDQPVDLEEFELLWAEISYLHWCIYDNRGDKQEATRRLKEIKHRFFNEVLR